MKIHDLHDLFVHELRDVYHAEKQILKALPKMARSASSDTLRAAFEAHLEETKGQVSRLEEVFDELGLKAKGKACAAMEGLIDECKDLIDEADENALDAGLIACAQKVEHYEIASYGCLVTWAKRLGERRAAELLSQTLAEEKATDQKLTRLAEGEANPEAEEVVEGELVSTPAS